MDKLKTKDLVTIGIFGAIYFVISLLVAVLGIFPKLIIIIPPLTALLGGVVVMLFMAKVPKRWALFILGMITPLLMWAMGHTYVVPLTALVFIGIAEFVFRKGGFKSLKYNSLAYATFSLWSMGAILQMVLLQERYIEMQTSAGIAEETILELVSLITPINIILIAVLTFLGGLLGAFIGKKMLKKHFEKAGVV